MVLAASAYYEQVPGSDPAGRQAWAVADLDYLITRYGSNPAWLHVGGKPVVFLYARALQALSMTRLLGPSIPFGL